MRYASLPIALLALSLLVAVPARGAPNLQVGSYASYNLSVRVSFSPPFCETLGTSGIQNNVIACPLNESLTTPSTVEVNGTIGWNTLRLNNTVAVLNVTRDLRTYLSDNFTTPVFHIVGSFNESILLSNRTISVEPIIRPEIDQAMQIAGAFPSASNWTSSMNTIESVMWVQPSVYTMWWVNGPLKLNQTVPVLVFPTNVTSASSISLGGTLGTRPAWNLTKAFPMPSSMGDSSLASSIPIGDTFLSSFSFNYDQQSDILLSASADNHLGFIEPVVINCVPSANTTCPATALASTCFTISSGIDVQASLTLAKTNLNLSQRLGSGGDTSGTGSGSGSGMSGSNSGSGSSNGGSSSGTNGGTSGTSNGNGGSTSSGTNNGGNSGTSNGNTAGSTTTGSNPTPLTTGSKSIASIPWIYWVLGLIAIVVIVTSTIILRRRRRN